MVKARDRKTRYDPAEFPKSLFREEVWTEMCLDGTVLRALEDL